MDQGCVQCGRAIERGNAGSESPGRVRMGRPPRYCSNACKTRAYRVRQADRGSDESSVHDLISAMRDALTRIERAAPEADRGDLAILASGTRTLRRLFATGAGPDTPPV